MKKSADELVMKMFLKTGDPFYYVARNVLREREQSGLKDDRDSNIKS